MIRLVRTELYRWRGRTLLWILAAVTVAFAVLVPASAWNDSRAPSEQDLASAQQQVDDYEPPAQVDIDQCLADEAAEREAQDDPTIEFGCDWQPTVQDFLPWRQYFDSDAAGAIAGMGIVLVLVGVVMGASFVAAEFSTGAIGNWLTFAPRRGRVLTSKLVATALGYLPTAVVGVGVLVGGTWLAYRLNDAMRQPDAHFDEAARTTVSEVALMGGRMVVVAIAMGVAGAALGFLLRHTAAVLGLLVGWAVVFEAVLRSLVPTIQPYLLSVNLDAWVRGGTQYSIEKCSPDPEMGGISCEWISHPVSQAHGAVVLGIVLVVLVGLAALVFRRRDVS